MASLFRNACVLAFAAAGLLAPAARAENVKIAFIDPFSGPLGVITQNALQTYRVAEDLARKEKGFDGNTLEFVPFDNKMSPTDSLLQLKAAIDQGYRYITQGVGSGIAAGLIDAIEKHNQRNPGKEVVMIDWIAADPELTNSKCSFWHFRTESHSDMKAEGLTSLIAKDPSVKKLYLINPNTASGQLTSRVVKEYLKRKRPDIEVVGDDLFAMGQVKDFTPYIAKMRAAGADSLLSSNSSVELGLLVKSVREADLKAKIFTFYANGKGAASAIGAAGVDRVKIITFFHPNADIAAAQPLADAMRKEYDEDFVVTPIAIAVSMLHQGFKVAKSTDPVKVAFAMEGLKFKTIAGEVEMRKSDHQIQMPLYLAGWAKADGKVVKYDQEKTGFGWRPEQKLESYVASQPTTCQMKRPPQPAS